MEGMARHMRGQGQAICLRLRINPEELHGRNESRLAAQDRRTPRCAPFVVPKTQSYANEVLGESCEGSL